MEATAARGGMGTGGLVPAWCPFTDGDDSIVYRGLAQTVFERACVTLDIPEDAYDWVPIDAEQLKRVYDELMKEHGVHVLFLTQLCGVAEKDGRIEHILLANKSGLSYCTAGVFVDATGDADMVRFAGGAFLHDGEGQVQPGTLCFTITGVNMEEYWKRPNRFPRFPNSPIYKIAEDPRYPLIRDTHCCNSYICSSTVGFNAGHIFDIDA